MNDRIKMFLLKLLNEDKDISRLEKIGYKYSEIANEYSKLINEKYIIVNDKFKFVLSDAGHIELQKLIEYFNNTKEWEIEPYVKYKTEKLDKYDIFLE